MGIFNIAFALITTGVFAFFGYNLSRTVAKIQLGKGPDTVFRAHFAADLEVEGGLAHGEGGCLLHAFGRRREAFQQ